MRGLVEVESAKICGLRDESEDVFCCSKPERISLQSDIRDGFWLDHSVDEKWEADGVDAITSKLPSLEALRKVLDKGGDGFRTCGTDDVIAE
jgi:hypothetical protein